jgi:RNA polymerase sigma-70 factor (ECF subfamily)
VPTVRDSLPASKLERTHPGCTERLVVSLLPGKDSRSDNAGRSLPQLPVAVPGPTGAVLPWSGESVCCRRPTAMDEQRDRPDITRLLREWQAGSADALERLMPLVYDELRTLASRYLSRERRDHILQTTALVHEAYLKLAGQRDADWQSRSHFFGIAAQLMRRILVDHARRHRRSKRGGGAAHLSLEEVDPENGKTAVDAVDAYDLDQALTRLEGLDPSQGRVGELR